MTYLSLRYSLPIIFSALTISACSFWGDAASSKSDTSNISPSTARFNAISTISLNSENAIDAFSTSMSPAIVGDTVQELSDKVVPGWNLISIVDPISSTRSQYSSLNSTPDTGTIANSSDLPSLITWHSLYLLLHAPLRNEDSIDYTPDKVSLCAKYIELEYMNCLRIWDNVLTKQHLLSPYEGTLTLFYSDYAPAMISYGPNYLYIDLKLVDLAGALRDIAVVVNGPDFNISSVPSEATGIVSLKFDNLPSLNKSATLSIMESIMIRGTYGSNLPYEIAVSKSQPVVSLLSSTESKSIQLAFGLNEIQSTYAWRDNNNEEHNNSLSIGGFHGDISLGQNDDNLHVSNLSFGDEPSVLTIDDTVAYSLDYSPLNMMVGLDQIVYLTHHEEKTYISNIFGYMESAFNQGDFSLSGMYSMSIPENTTVFPVQDTITGNALRMVNSGGPIHLLGNGYFRDDTYIGTNECFEVYGDTLFNRNIKKECP